jgi:hypothetical protein
MKFLKYLLIIIIFIAGIGYALYYFGTNMVSDKVVDALYTELENSGKLEEVIQIINDDPEIKSFIEEGANIDESQLPFKTKEQATRALVQKFGPSKILDVQSSFQNGMSSNEVEQLLKEVESKLTEEEILALKVLAYKELSK